MTCPQEQEVLTGSPAGAAHAASCAECAESLRLLAGARVVVGAGRPELTGAARARMWRTIETGHMRPRFGFTGFVPAALAAAFGAAILLLVFRPADPTINEQKPVHATTAAKIEHRGSKLALAAGAPLSIDTDPVKLEAGELEIALADGVAFEVVTTDVRVLAIGASFKIGAGAGGTHVAVRSGSVRAGDQVVSAGEERTFRDLDLDRLARHADELRRGGSLDKAAGEYLALAARAGANAYAEEALYRAAKIFADIGHIKAARETLADAKTRFPNGALAPERTLLEETLDHEK